MIINFNLPTSSFLCEFQSLLLARFSSSILNNQLPFNKTYFRTKLPFSACCYNLFLTICSRRNSKIHFVDFWSFWTLCTSKVANQLIKETASLCVIFSFFFGVIDLLDLLIGSFPPLNLYRSSRLVELCQACGT